MTSPRCITESFIQTDLLAGRLICDTRRLVHDTQRLIHDTRRLIRGTQRRSRSANHHQAS